MIKIWCIQRLCFLFLPFVSHWYFYWNWKTIWLNSRNDISIYSKWDLLRVNRNKIDTLFIDTMIIHFVIIVLSMCCIWGVFLIYIQGFINQKTSWNVWNQILNSTIVLGAIVVCILCSCLLISQLALCNHHFTTKKHEFIITTASKEVRTFFGDKFTMYYFHACIIFKLKRL